MRLHVETAGSGAPLVMLHGWGMHGGVWSDVAAELAQHFAVHSVDLPGHGHGALGASELTLDGMVDALSRQFSEPVSVCGWSLGGIIAQHWAARAPQQVKRLVLVASTPCFAQRPDWPHGMPLATLEQFAAELEQNHAATLRRFLALQVRGSEGERELLAALRARLESRGEPDLNALRGGLDILRHADLRHVLPQLAQPALLIAGGRDKLTPAAASCHMAEAMPNARAVVVAGASHAPFMSHRGIFVDQLKEFLA